MAKRHKTKEINAAVVYAMDRGWTLVLPEGGNAHLWGTLLCPAGDRDGHTFRVRSTPKHPEDHARDLKRAVDRCQHRRPEGRERGGPPPE
jgi:hypothetical protein